MARLIVADLVVDSERCPTANHVANWAERCPGNNESAGKRKGECMGDLDDLKAPFDRANKAPDMLDLNTWSDQWHDQLVDFPPFMVEGKAAVRQMFETLWTNTESLTVAPIKTQFRVIGTTGLV